MLFEDNVMKAAEKSSIYPPREIDKWMYSNTPMNFYCKLKEKVLGQDQELRKAAILVYGFLSAMVKGDFNTRFHFLIEGSSGCGKSTFANALKAIAPCPVIIADASQITPAGYRGTDISDLVSTDELRKWYNCGIVILDELDKLMEPSTIRDNDNYHRQALENCLRMLDGGDITDRDGNVINCDKMLFIGMGVFSPVRKNILETAQRNIGFAVKTCASTNSVSSMQTQKIKKETMSDFCGSEQFLGRFTTVLHFKKRGKAMYKQILRQLVEDLMFIYGIPFALSYEQETKIIEEAMVGDFGCRGIKSAVWETFLNTDIVITQQDFEILHMENILSEIESPNFQRKCNWSA